jgi:hypothetical protein
VLDPELINKIIVPQRSARLAARDVTTRPAAGLIDTWQDAISTFGAHCGSILVWIVVSVALSIFLQYFLSSLVFTTLYTWALIQVGLIVSIQALAYGAIAWIALHGDEHHSGSWPLHEALRRWPALVCGSVVNMLLIGVCVTGLTMWLRAQASVSFGVTSIEAPVDQIARQVASRSVSMLLFHPDLPSPDTLVFANGAAAERRERMVVIYHHRLLQAEYIDPVQPSVLRALTGQVLAMSLAHKPNDRDAMIGLSSCFVFALLETLLRLRTITALTSRKRGLIAPVVESVRLGWTRFVTIASHVWLLKFMIVIGYLVFVVVPVVSVQIFVVPSLPWAIRAALSDDVGHGLLLLSIAVPGALLAAFSAVYDARLYLALTRPAASPRLQRLTAKQIEFGYK